MFLLNDTFILFSSSRLVLVCQLSCYCIVNLSALLIFICLRINLRRWPFLPLDHTNQKRTKNGCYNSFISVFCIVLNILYLARSFFFFFYFYTIFCCFFFCRHRHWRLASPWLHGINPRDSLMPKDGDDGFFPTTGNELVSALQFIS